MIVGGSEDGKVYLWDLQSKALLHTLEVSAGWNRMEFGCDAFHIGWRIPLILPTPPHHTTHPISASATPSISSHPISPNPT